jgi:hypothetical protein
MTGKIIVSHLDNSFDCIKYCIIFYPICQSSHNMIRLLVYPQENQWEDIFIYIEVWQNFLKKLWMALPQLFLPTQMLIVVEYRSIPKLILLSRMLQQVLHLTKSYFPEERGRCWKVYGKNKKRSWKQFLQGKWLEDFLLRRRT